MKSNRYRKFIAAPGFFQVIFSMKIAFPAKGVLLISFLLALGIACKSNQPKHFAESENHGLFHIPFESSDQLDHPTMVLVLHGDAPFSKPSYQYGIAKKIAAENSNTVAVGILRPGYTDEEGNHSQGVRGEAVGDNYTSEVLKSIHQLATELIASYEPSKVVLLGHSGGAAISANLLAQYSNRYTDALLLSCPCDLHQWRQHMKARNPEAQIWNLEVRSLSPIEQIPTVNDSANILLLHGQHDEIVPLSIATNYVEQLKANQKPVTFVPLENQGHEIAFHPRVFELIKGLIE